MLMMEKSIKQKVASAYFTVVNKEKSFIDLLEAPKLSINFFLLLTSFRCMHSNTLASLIVPVIL